MIAQRAGNRYIVIPPRSDKEIVWNPFDTNDCPVADCAFISGVVVAMEQHSGVRGLTVYVTWNLERLPAYGNNVIAIVLGDEWCRIPRYAARVRAVFKTYGTRLPIDWRALLRPTPYELAALAQDLRTAMRQIPNLAAFTFDRVRGFTNGKRRKWNIYDIPLGYYRQVTLPFVPISERRFDVYFAGSVTNRGHASRPLLRFTPKFLSRANMLARLASIGARRPDLAISTSLTAGFLATTSDDAVRYSETMMQTKICLVPRGTSLETYRYFEGLRFGCVVISERLPDRRFYRGAPALRVRDWSELDELIPNLLADHERLANLSRASLSWWSERCSEEATGRYIASRLRTAAGTRGGDEPSSEGC